MGTVVPANSFFHNLTWVFETLDKTFPGLFPEELR
jgi:hypothetical protein